jgi:hypothetical protein
VSTNATEPGAPVPPGRRGYRRRERSAGPPTVRRTAIRPWASQVATGRRRCNLPPLELRGLLAGRPVAVRLAEDTPVNAHRDPSTRRRTSLRHALRRILIFGGAGKCRHTG